MLRSWPSKPGARRYGINESDHDGFVEIDDVAGMIDSDGNSINDVFKVKAMYKTYKKSDGKEGKRFNAYQFEIGDTSKFSKYEGGGVMTQKKVPFKREFKNFKESLRNPIGKGEYGLLFTDGSKFGRGEQLHFALQGVWEFQARNGRLPVSSRGRRKRVFQVCERDTSSDRKMKVPRLPKKLMKR